jgi:hypothetical protein
MIFLFFVIGFIIGWFALRALINFKVKLMLDSIANSPIADPAKTINLDFFKEKGSIYVHNRDTSEFLARGKDREEITELLKKKYPNTPFVANTKNLKEVFDDTI